MLLRVVFFADSVPFCVSLAVYLRTYIHVMHVFIEPYTYVGMVIHTLFLIAALHWSL